MKTKNVVVILLALGTPVLVSAGAPRLHKFARAAESSSAASADRAFLKAVQDKDMASASHLLRADFSWINSRGERMDRAEFLRSFPSAVLADVPAQERVYGNTAVEHVDRGQVHMKRIWVKQSSGWQLLLYQEVTQVEKSEPAGGVPNTECVNPCKTIPFEPQTQSEKEAVASWQGVMKAMAENDADAYAPLIADEFTATDTYHDRPYTKTDRLAQIAKQKSSGSRSAPPELLSAQMYDFGDSVVMIAREQRRVAKAYFNTRMWVKRDGRWQMLFSFNTRID
jgi:hypothetical protein